MPAKKRNQKARAARAPQKKSRRMVKPKTKKPRVSSNKTKGFGAFLHDKFKEE